MKWSVVVLALALTLGGMNAQAAKRLGGGLSFGKQSGNVAQRNTAPAAPAAPSQGVTNAPKPAPAVAPPQAPTRRPWAAMLGGVAAGLGLAWLASSLGLGEAFGQILMFGLLAMGLMLLVGLVLRKRQSDQAAAQASPFAFQGANRAPLPAARPYRPENVGNDASARPFERSNLAPLEANESSMIGSALSGSQSWGVPAGFDSAGFLQAAKTNFVTLQAAWDRSDAHAAKKAKAVPSVAVARPSRTELVSADHPPGTAPTSRPCAP